jgi:predicted Zn-dependent protease
LWLIENGKISKPVKNLAFTESVLFALNKVDALGVPQRAFHPPISWFTAIPQPVIVPALKIDDFSFTSLSDAV